MLPAWLHIGAVLPVWAWLLGFVVLNAVPQGIVTWHLREYVPAGRLDWLDAALHAGGVLAYAWAVYGRVPHAGAPWAWAWLLRWLLFDLVLMLTWNYINHREHRPAESLFQVGTTAATDRLTRWVATRLGQSPGHVRAASWGLAASLTVGLAFWVGWPA